MTNTCPRCKRKYGERKRCQHCQPARRRTGANQECATCGEGFYVPQWEAEQEQGPRKYCSPRCQYAAMRGRERVSGSRYIDSRGYVMVKVGIHRHRAEHRLVMEKALGRSLTTDEHVHHKDGDKQNNALENLEVLTNAEHQQLHDWPHTRSRRVVLTCTRCGSAYERKRSRAGESRYCSNICRFAALKGE